LRARGGLTYLPTSSPSPEGQDIRHTGARARSHLWMFENSHFSSSPKWRSWHVPFHFIPLQNPLQKWHVPHQKWHGPLLKWPSRYRGRHAERYTSRHPDRYKAETETDTETETETDTDIDIDRRDRDRDRYRDRDRDRDRDTEFMP